MASFIVISGQTIKLKMSKAGVLKLLSKNYWVYKICLTQ